MTVESIQFQRFPRTNKGGLKMIEYGFFNSVDDDRLYNADSFNEFFNGILSETGVYKKSGDGLKVIPGDDLSVTISTGKARIKEHFINVKSVENLTLEPSDLTLNRWDAICLRYNQSERTITPFVIKGSSATEPSKPYRNAASDLYDICLAYVYIPAGATTITADNITDTREDTSLCGYVKMQIDTVNAGIREYRSIYKTTSETTEIPINISQFDVDNDLLFANINGVMFIQDSDYTISGTGSNAKIVLTNSVNADNTIEFRVIKSVIEVL